MLIFCAVMLFTVSISFSPANAAMMIGCETETPSASDHAQAHIDHHSQLPDEAHDDADASSGHPSKHCASHACSFGISANSPALSAGLAETRLGGEPFASSLVPLTIPDGLRRPPRA